MPAKIQLIYITCKNAARPPANCRRLCRYVPVFRALLLRGHNSQNHLYYYLKREVQFFSLQLQEYHSVCRLFF
jgi:hypothetical protein